MDVFFEKYTSIFNIDQKVRDAVLNNAFPAERTAVKTAPRVEISDAKIKKNDHEVTVVGFGNAALGTGEDTRLVARALQAVGVSVNIFPIEIEGNYIKPNHSVKIESSLSKEVVIFCMPPINTASLLMSHGSDIFSARHNIGFWPWEFSQWKKEYSWVQDFMSEIWGISSFAARAFECGLSKPVKKMSLPMDLDQIDEVAKSESRADSHFTFFYNFDFNSSIYRKNPMVLIRAFKKEFGADEPVRLALKILNKPNSEERLATIYQEMKDDPRISVIAGNLSYEENLRLMKSASDCYVSPHRGEGFGRTIAEAVGMEIPVICSNYSGNLDFTLVSTADLINGSTISVATGEYPFASGLKWFDADESSLARLLRNVYENPAHAREKAKLGKKYLFDHHGLSSCGQEYRKRILEIQKTFDD